MLTDTMLADRTDTDLALWRRLRAGDARAFETLYRRHEASLYRFALLRCGRPELAADVIQEVFLALLDDSLKFDPLRGPLPNFLFGVTRNMLARRQEDAGRYLHREHDDDDDIDLAQADTAPLPLERLLASEDAQRVHVALQRIAAHYRDVLILYEIHDLSYAEIAQVCAIDIGTVRSRLSRARARLAALLASETSHPAATTSGIPS